MTKTQMVTLPLEYVVGEALQQELITQEFIDQVSSEFGG